MFSTIISSLHICNSCSAKESSVGAIVPTAHMSLEARIKTEGCTEKNLLALINSESCDELFNNATIQLGLIEGLLNGMRMSERVIDKLKTCTPCITPQDQKKFIRRKECYIAETIKNEHPFILRFFLKGLDQFSDPNLESLLRNAINDEWFSNDKLTQKSIALAVNEEQFSNKTKVLEIIDESKHRFTDTKAQKYIELATRGGHFDRDTKMPATVDETTLINYENNGSETYSDVGAQSYACRSPLDQD